MSPQAQRIYQLEMQIMAIETRLNEPGLTDTRRQTLNGLMAMSKIELESIRHAR